MELENVTATLKKLRREVGKGATPSVKRERELYSALLGLIAFVEELDAGSRSRRRRGYRVEAHSA